MYIWAKTQDVSAWRMAKLCCCCCFAFSDIVHSTLHALHLSWQAIHVTNTHMFSCRDGMVPGMHLLIRSDKDGYCWPCTQLGSQPMHSCNLCNAISF